MKKSALVILLLMFSLAVTGCDMFPTATPVKTPPPPDLTDMELAVSASGEVTPEKYSALSMAAAGIVEEILVKDGDTVVAGQPLVRLSGREDIQARIAAAEYALAEAQKAYDSLKSNAATQFALAKKTLADAQKALQDAKDERYRKNLARVAQTTIDQKQSDLVIAKDALKKARERYTDLEKRPEGDVEKAQAFSALASAQAKVDQIEKDLNWLLAGPNATEIAQADAAIVVAQSRLDDAQREYDLLKDGPNPVDQKVAVTRISNAEAQLAAAKKALAGLELRAPYNGVVSDPKVRIGEFLNVGQTALQLVDTSSLRIETTDLSETDVTRIRIGDTVTVTFDALPGVKVAGKVIKINTKAAAGSGVNFTVIIELSQVPEGLRWGMTAFVEINTPLN